MQKLITGDTIILRDSMDSLPLEVQAHSKKALENYAIAYVGAYMNTVQKERPEHVPALARTAPHMIDVSLLPNNCFCMMFERAEKQEIAVAERGWDYVEGKVHSGIGGLVAVYAHEGVTVADAIARGKKDAVRDIRAVEDSAIAKAVTHISRILESLHGVEKGNKGMLKIAQMELDKMQPIRDAVLSSGPEVDMLALVDALKNYPSKPVAVNIDFKEKELLESLARDLGDLSDLIRRIETQDKKLEEMEQALRKNLSEFNRSIEERISKGLAIILSSSDRKIDKGLAAVTASTPKELDPNALKELVERLKKLEEALVAAEQKPSVSQEVVLAVAEVRTDVVTLGKRITKIEELLSEKAPRVRTLKQT